jgi:RNA polymerase sigma factor (sigma-70 family)
MACTAFDIELDDLTLARARRGDMAACATLFQLFRQPAYTIAFRVCQCEQLAQDVTQEAFVNAFRRIRQFRGDAPFWGWLRRVVINHAISALRKQPRFDMLELEEGHAIHQGEQARIDLATDLAAAFASLAAADRSIVWLHDVEGYSHKEIADLFEMTESFSKTRLSRAHTRLRQLLDPSLHPDASEASPAVTHIRQSCSANSSADPAAQSANTTVLSLSTGFQSAGKA